MHLLRRRAAERGSNYGHCAVTTLWQGAPAAGCPSSVAQSWTSQNRYLRDPIVSSRECSRPRESELARGPWQHRQEPTTSDGVLATFSVACQRALSPWPNLPTLCLLEFSCAIPDTDRAGAHDPGIHAPQMQLFSEGGIDPLHCIHSESRPEFPANGMGLRSDLNSRRLRAPAAFQQAGSRRSSPYPGTADPPSAASAPCSAPQEQSLERS